MENRLAASSPNLITDPIAPTLKRMTIPVSFGMIMLMTLGLVDIFFIGLIGTEPLAAISFTLPITFIVISLVIGLGIGTSAVVARELGQDKTEKAKSYATTSLYLGVTLVGVCSVILFLLLDPIFSAMGATPKQLAYIKEYMNIWCLSPILLSFPMIGNSVLRASGDTKTPSLIMASAGLFNAALDPILIFGWGPIPAYGVQGAAIATFISYLIGTFIILYILGIKRGLITFRRMPISDLKEGTSKIMKIGVPAAFANMLTPFAGAILTSVVAGYGSAAVAAWGVGSRIEAIASIVVLALSMSLPPLISQNLGAEKLNRVEEAYKIVVKFVLGWQLVIWILLLLLAPLIAMMFSSEQSVRNAIVAFLWIVPLGYGVQGIVILTNSSFNALHKPINAMLLNIARLFVFYIPLAWLGSHFFGLNGLFWGCVVANLFIAIMSYQWFTKELNALACK